MMLRQEYVAIIDYWPARTVLSLPVGVHTECLYSRKNAIEDGTLAWIPQ